MTTRTTFCPACHSKKCDECDQTGKRYVTADMLIIEPDGHMHTQETTPATVLKQTQQILACYVQVVSGRLLDASIATTCTVLVNEEGMLLDLPINPRAVGELHCKAPLYGRMVVLPRGVFT